MSLFGSLMGDFEDDPIFGHHMRSMRQMNSIMSSLMSDPFGMASPFDGFGPAGNRHSALTGATPHYRPVMGNSLMPFGFQSMPNINSLLGGDFGEGGGAPSYCSSSFVSMSHGPDGRPQVYQATSSTKTGPGGVRETRKTVQDSRTGLKKMAIGHHIGERAHIIERERNLREGTEEERQDYINIDEEEAEDFDREFTNKARGPSRGVTIQAIQDAPSRPPLLALPAPPSSDDKSSRRPLRNVPKVTTRRPLRTPTSSPLALPPTSRLNVSSSPKSVRTHPYPASAHRRHHQHHRPKNTSAPSQTNAYSNSNNDSADGHHED